MTPIKEPKHPLASAGKFLSEKEKAKLIADHSIITGQPVSRKTKEWLISILGKDYKPGVF